jgi:Protein of unknown function (DUF2794)
MLRVSYCYTYPARGREDVVSETEVIFPFRLREAGSGPEPCEAGNNIERTAPRVSFNRKELDLILKVYGSHVAEGEWRDYAVDFSRDQASFSVFRRTSEMPLYRIVKEPRLARKQGMYSIMAQGGLILKRGHDLAQVLRFLTRAPKLVSV